MKNNNNDNDKKKEKQPSATSTPDKSDESRGRNRRILSLTSAFSIPGETLNTPRSEDQSRGIIVAGADAGRGIGIDHNPVKELREAG